MNAISKKQYDLIKNERYTVISYNPKTNKRNLTYSGLSLLAASNHIIEQQKAGRRTILLHNYDPKTEIHCSWNMDDYEEAIQTSSTIKEE